MIWEWSGQFHMETHPFFDPHLPRSIYSVFFFLSLFLCSLSEPSSPTPRHPLSRSMCVCACASPCRKKERKKERTKNTSPPLPLSVSPQCLLSRARRPVCPGTERWRWRWRWGRRNRAEMVTVEVTVVAYRPPQGHGDPVWGEERGRYGPSSHLFPAGPCWSFVTRSGVSGAHGTSQRGKAKRKGVGGNARLFITVIPQPVLACLPCRSFSSAGSRLSFLSVGLSLNVVKET